MFRNNRFSHGTYGDDSGVIFSSITEDGSREELSISDAYIEPLFRAAIGVTRSSGSKLPRLLEDWIALQGWSLGGELEVVAPHVESLIDVLSRAKAHLSEIDNGMRNMADVIECAVVIVQFLKLQQSKRRTICIEDD